MQTAAPSLSVRRPNHVGDLIAALVVIVGVSVGVGYAVSGLLTTLSAPDRFDRTTVGGSLTANIETAGPVLIYVEATVVPSLAELDLTVTDASGSVIPVTPYPRDLRYDRAGGVGRAVGAFDAAAPGPYQIVSAAPRTTDVIAVGADIGDEVIEVLGRAAAIGGLALAAALIVVAGSALLRRR